MNNGQTIFGTSIECPECEHEEEGLHSDGRHYWCNQCGFGKGENIKTDDLPDYLIKVEQDENNTGI